MVYTVVVAKYYIVLVKEKLKKKDRGLVSLALASSGSGCIDTLTQVQKAKMPRVRSLSCYYPVAGGP